MTKIKEHTLETRLQIVALRQAGKSFIQIKKELGVAEQTARDLMKKYETTGSVGNRPRSGRHKKTTSKEDRAIVREVKKDPLLPSRVITNIVKTNLKVNVSSSTIKRRLYEKGFKGYVTRLRTKISLNSNQKNSK